MTDKADRTNTTATETPQRSLHWLKYNPTEWQGRCSQLSDAEYGLYHRVVEVLWRTDGTKIAKDVLAIRLRLAKDPERAEMLEQLILLQELREEDGMIDIPFLHDEYAQAISRSKNGATGGIKAAANRRAKQEAAQAAH